MDKFFEIFRAGDYPQGNFTEADLDEIVSNFDDTFQGVPVTIFHKGKSDGLAYGWIKELKRQGKSLLASFKDVSDDLKEHVAAKKLRNHSVAIYKDLAGKGKYLRELAMLGAEPPAVKGMKAIEFSEGEFETIDFSSESPFMIDMVISYYQEMADDYKSEKEKAEQELKDKTAEFTSSQEAVEFAQRKSAFESFLDEKSEKGALPPVVREKCVSLFEHLDAVETKDGEPTAVEIFQELMGEIKTQVEFEEEFEDGDLETTEFSAEELGELALEFREEQRAKGIIISATEAVNHIKKTKQK